MTAQKHSPAVVLYKKLLAQHGRSRESIVNYLTDIGEYTRFRDDDYPIEINVSLHDANLDPEFLWEKLVEDGDYYAAPEDPVKLAIDKRLFLKEAASESLFWDAAEDTVRSYQDSDTYNTSWNCLDFEVEWSLHGRCGKHLCLDSFTYEGHSINLKGMRQSDLLEELSLKEDGQYAYSYRWLRAFLVCVIQFVVDFEELNYHCREAEYQARFSCLSRTEGEADEEYTALLARGAIQRRVDDYLECPEEAKGVEQLVRDLATYAGLNAAG